MSDIRILDAASAERERAALAGILVDGVEGGASIGFVAPFTPEEAQAWWGGIVGEVRAGETILFGAYADGTLIGTAQLSRSPKPNQRHRADVKKLLVHRDRRGQGVATLLMDALEAEARRHAVTLLTLDTATGSEAERLYDKLGWTRAGIIPNYALWPDGRFCDVTFFWKAL